MDHCPLPVHEINCNSLGYDPKHVGAVLIAALALAMSLGRAAAALTFVPAPLLPAHFWGNRRQSVSELDRRPILANSSLEYGPATLSTVVSAWLAAAAHR